MSRITVRIPDSVRYFQSTVPSSVVLSFKKKKSSCLGSCSVVSAVSSWNRISVRHELFSDSERERPSDAPIGLKCCHSGLGDTVGRAYGFEVSRRLDRPRLD